MRTFKQFKQKSCKRLVLIFGITSLSIPIICDQFITWSNHVYQDVEDIPYRPVGLVLGTAKTYQGKPNQFLIPGHLRHLSHYILWRLQTAFELFQAGKIDGILVSGDNGRRGYNEPALMKQDLVSMGIPEEFITCDYAGFRTLDSVVRAKKVFGQSSFTIISQPFHVKRAQFLANHYGIDTVALGAENPTLEWWLKIRMREVLARTLAVLDVAIARQPELLGKPEQVKLRKP